VGTGAFARPAKRIEASPTTTTDWYLAQPPDFGVAQRFQRCDKPKGNDPFPQKEPRLSRVDNGRIRPEAPQMKIEGGISKGL
jgi:hypothetical protein